MKYLLLLHLFALSTITIIHAKPHSVEFSTAGFFNLEKSGRVVYNMNPAWRFIRGDAAQAFETTFDDSRWDVVSLPHGIEYLPIEASGCVNYQGVVWYRKHFTPDISMKGNKVFLHFEAIMGKCKVWVNGTLVKEHFGGYLPVIADISDKLIYAKDNVIAVMADNSDDPSYPPGKAQDVLDYTYFGGIYRDCWLVTHNKVHITDPNFENTTAGGGVFVAYDKVSEQQASVLLKTQVRNASESKFAGNIEYELIDSQNQLIEKKSVRINVEQGSLADVQSTMVVKSPKLWSPELPNLYQLCVRIKNAKGAVVDGYRRRIGIRSIGFKGSDGFWLNNKPYPTPLIGANRHQDFAVVGNAVANSTHWRDAKKLRDTGMKVIRSAHCPQDPAFMDACDELGLFVINNIPGWQFFSADSLFEHRVYDDIKNLVRRDRNHPCVWLWEPVLNETHTPIQFVNNSKELVMNEYPYPSCYTSTDYSAKGAEIFPIIFTHPLSGDGTYCQKELDSTKSYFTREWGDNVDNWNAQNSPSRASRNWGEMPMLVQAKHYAKPPYPYTSYDALYRTTRHHVGGTMWHAFDHQRGYHPDTFYGGIMDAFRQPKYSYYMFMAQRGIEKSDNPLIESGPMVYVAHEMTPFSPSDITVFSNCEQVRLTMNKGGKQYVYNKERREDGIPSPIITFKDAFQYEDGFGQDLRPDDIYALAEGLIAGKVVASHKVTPGRRPEKIVLSVDNEGMELMANGSDHVTVIATVVDKFGNAKRLNNQTIKFNIEGQGRIIGSPQSANNSQPISWGTAPILIQSTTTPGKIIITASIMFEGSHSPLSAQIELNSASEQTPMLYNISDYKLMETAKIPSDSVIKLNVKQKDEAQARESTQTKLKDVEKQQKEFGEKPAHGL